MKNIDRNDLNKVPMDLLISIKENRNEEYTPKIDYKNINQSLSPKAQALYIWLYKTYITQNKDEIKKINEVLKANEKKKMLKYNSEVFNKINNTEINNVISDETKEKNELEVYKESIISKIMKKIKSLFCRR